MKIILVSVIIAVLSGTTALGDCEPDLDKFEIQLAWMFNPDSINPFHDFIKKLQSQYMARIVNNIRDRYPGTTLALALVAGKDEIPCYKIRQKFTTDYEEFMTAMENITPKYGGISPEQIMLGLASVAVNAGEVGWKPYFWSPEGKRAIRIIMLLTDDESTPALDPLPEFGGCLRQWHPSAAGYILGTGEVYVSILAADNVYGTWQHYWQQMTAQSVTGRLRRLNFSQDESIIDEVLDTIRDAICVHVPTTTTTTTTTTTATTTASATTTTATNEDASGGGLVVPIAAALAAGGLVAAAAAGVYYYARRKRNVASDSKEDDFGTEECSS